MKIKIFNCAGDEEDVEKEVNSFIKDKKVIDMKFNADSKSGFVDWGWLFVMYEEQQDTSTYKFIDVIDDESEDKKCPYCDLKKDLYERSFLDTRGIPDNGPYYMSIMNDFGAGRFLIVTKIPSRDEYSSGERSSILIHYCPMCGQKL